jgi:glycerophosphoryl diester phosphodiesterase
MLRIGHRGAAALAPENTIESVRAAVEAGVDGVEFDVRPRLVVRHDRGRAGPTLREFLAQVREVVADDALLMLDLKKAGYEAETLAACRAVGIADRCVFCTTEFTVLERLNGVARTSATLSAGRAWVLPGRRTPAVAMYANSGALDATVRHDTVTEDLVEAVHARGGRVYAWTVNTREGIAQMRALGVDGVITDDPRLFHPAAENAGADGSVAPRPVQ